MSRARRVVALVVVPVLLLAAGLVYLDEVHSYRLRTEPFSFAHAGDELSGTLALPPGPGPFGVVVFLHGDGPTTADHDEGYLPIWEALADSGFASLAWDKPGVGASTGSWEHQSMQDRADEARAALDALRGHAEIDDANVGALAASQGGWPLPLLARERPLSFAVALSPAISWQRQGRYDLDTDLTAAGASPAVRDLAHGYSDRLRALAEQNAPYERYRVVESARPEALEPYFSRLSPDRWRFAVLNRSADATGALAALADTPVLLMLAGHDAHVDVRETEAVYRRVLGADCLRVAHHADANHSMLAARLGESGPRLWLQALWQPRDVFAGGVLDDVRDFAADHACGPRTPTAGPPG